MNAARSALWVVFLALLAWGAKADPSDVTPDFISQMIRVCDQTERPLELTAEQTEIILSGISHGQQRWIAVIPGLRRLGSVELSDQLIVAMSRALLVNPEPIVRLIGSKFAIERVCSDNDTNPSAADMQAYYDHALLAVRAIKTPGVEILRDACVDSLVRQQAEGKS